MKVELLDHMGDDLSVVNAARVSFDKGSEWKVRCTADCGEHGSHADPECRCCETTLKPGDARLIDYLARGCTYGDWEQLIAETCNAKYADDVVPILKHVRDMPTHWSPFAHTAIKFRVSAPI